MTDEQEESDDALMARIGRGDRRAFAIFSGRHLDRTHALARRMLGNAADAEDVVQDVFVQVWTRAAQWQPGKAKVSTWLYRVTANRCLDHHRRPKVQALDPEFEPADERPDAEAALGDRQREAALNRAIAALPDRQRAAIALCYSGGLSNIEAAETLEISVEALESLLSRARRTLRAQLAAA